MEAVYQVKLLAALQSGDTGVIEQKFVDVD